MKRRLLLCQSLFCLAGAAAHATLIGTTTEFNETVVYGTDTLENSVGAVLSTLQYGFWTDEIPPDIADDISTDPTFAASDSAAQSFLQSTASEAALTDDLTFLTGQLPDVFYTGTSPTVYTGSFPCCVPLGPLATLFPGFSVVSYAYGIDLVEQSSTAAPEPSSSLLMGCGLLAFAYRRTKR